MAGSPHSQNLQLLQIANRKSAQRFALVLVPPRRDGASLELGSWTLGASTFAFPSVTTPKGSPVFFVPSPGLWTVEAPQPRNKSNKSNNRFMIFRREDEDEDDPFSSNFGVTGISYVFAARRRNCPARRQKRPHLTLSPSPLPTQERRGKYFLGIFTPDGERCLRTAITAFLSGAIVRRPCGTLSLRWREARLSRGEEPFFLASRGPMALQKHCFHSLVTMGLSLPVCGDAQTRQGSFATLHRNLRLAPRQKDNGTALERVGGRGWSRLVLRWIRPLVLLVVSVSNPDISGAQTNCSGPWNTVTNWRGTYNLTLTGSGPYESGTMQINNSSGGSFVLTNEFPSTTTILAGTVNGTGSIDVSASSPCPSGSARATDTCSVSGSGSLIGAWVYLVIDTNHCTYQISFDDPIAASSETIDCGGGISTNSGDVPASELVASPPSAGGSQVLPSFPLPDFGEALTESGGTFAATNLGVGGCAETGSFTLTVSWNIQPEISGGTNSVPLLEIIRSGTNVVLFWPTNAMGFVPQSKTNLIATNAWNNVTNIPAVVGATNYVTNSITGSTLFYRLIH